MPHKQGGKFVWGNIEANTQGELSKKVWGIWKKNGSKGDFGHFYETGKIGEAQEGVDEATLDDVDMETATVGYYTIDVYDSGSDLAKSMKKHNVKFVRYTKQRDSFIWYITGKKKDLIEWLSGPGGMDEDDVEEYYDDELFEAQIPSDNIDKINSIAESILVSLKG